MGRVQGASWSNRLRTRLRCVIMLMDEVVVGVGAGAGVRKVLTEVSCFSYRPIHQAAWLAFQMASAAALLMLVHRMSEKRVSELTSRSIELFGSKAGFMVTCTSQSTRG